MKLCSVWLSWLAAAALEPLSLAAAETLVMEHPQLAGISGFRAHWDAPVTLASDGLTVKGEPFKEWDPLRAEWDPVKRKGQPGAIAFDSLQRCALVRFPNAAEQIAKQVNNGFQMRPRYNRATAGWRKMAPC